MAVADDRKLKPHYVTSVIAEFFRSLIENQIPQQAALQNMLIKYVLDCLDFSPLHMCSSTTCYTSTWN